MSRARQYVQSLPQLIAQAVKEANEELAPPAHSRRAGRQEHLASTAATS